MVDLGVLGKFKIKDKKLSHIPVEKQKPQIGNKNNKYTVKGLLDQSLIQNRLPKL